MSGRYATFEERKITPETFVKHFEEMCAMYPHLEVKSPMRLPTRYIDGVTGLPKFHMKTTYQPGDKFTPMKTESARRKAGAVNIVLSHPTKPDNQIVLTPEDLIKKLRICEEAPSSATEAESEVVDDPFDTSPPPKASVSEKVQAILERRKKEAFVSI